MAAENGGGATMEDVEEEEVVTFESLVCAVLGINNPSERHSITTRISSVPSTLPHTANI